MKLLSFLAPMLGFVLIGQAFAQELRLGDGANFSFDALAAEAKRLSTEPPRAPRQVPEWLADIDYDTFRSIRFKPEVALWSDRNSPFRVQLFHSGVFYNRPVDIYTVRENVVDRVEFSQDMFSYDAPLPGDPSEIHGFAGFRLHYPINQSEVFDEVIAFLGASYFRAVGRDSRYGASARGLAVDTGTVDGEEFPSFTAFWLEEPSTATSVVIYALLESQSVVGAYRFEVVPGERTEVATQARLFFRAPVERLGIAPLTSMYLFGPNDRAGADDYRPRVHDSQGLILWRQDESIVWRPLANPARLHWSVIHAENPKAFGLIQRDREFTTFQDLEARYDLRPSVWIEPIAPFGSGNVMLLELPAPTETHDNIVAFWSPMIDIEAGSELTISYRVFWSKQSIVGSATSRVLDTRVGTGGVAGSRPAEGTRKVVIDYSAIDRPIDQITPVVNAGSAEVTKPVLQLNPITGSYRLFFDVTPVDTPTELSAWLEADGNQVSETWIYRLDEL